MIHDPEFEPPRLRDTITQAVAHAECSLKDLTVLAVQNDPFRIDTPAGHRDGKWLADNLAELGLGTREIHPRGMHYMLLGRTKPNGEPYINDDSNWSWLIGHAAKAARWLRYLPFEQIRDQRNAEPEIRRFTMPTPDPYINVGIDVTIPSARDLRPEVFAFGFESAQPYKLVFFGEKSSLADILVPVCERHEADLYLPTGEISDTLMHTMAATAHADPRPMVVLCFSDADPAGWQMPISIGRKLQAFRAFGYDYEFQVVRVALTPDQVREYGLPSTPLKDTERRADGWRSAMGVDQTEIDALAALRPDTLRAIVRDALVPFYDDSLASRTAAARREWRQEAQRVVDSALDADGMARIIAEATEKLDGMRVEIARLNSELRVDVDEFDLPAYEIPEPEIRDEAHGVPLIDSRWSFVDQCRRLIDSKSYRNGDHE